MIFRCCTLTLCLFTIIVTETVDGYVEVTGFTEKASNLVRYAVKVGDRVLAVDSSLGDRMWPVSTVEGVISAVTSRLPGQQITFRFERNTSNMGATSNTNTVVVQPSPAAESIDDAATGASNPKTNAALLERCRDVIKRYTTDQKYVNKFSLPGVVADKVVNALASAGTQVDPYTLSMIQTAYLSCRQPEKAIQLFEEAVGLRADGSNGEFVRTNIVESDDESNPFIGNGGKRLVPNLDSLDVFTVSAILKAQAMKGNLSAVKRVLAALEGHSGTFVDELEVAWWPGTGADGDLQPNNRCYNIVMSAAADSGAEDGLALALDIFGKLSEPTKASSRTGRALEKDAVSYNTIIKALTNNGRYDEAIKVFYEMKRSGVKPDKYSYTSLVKAVLAQDSIEEFLYDMRDQGVAPDTMTFNTIIRNLCEQRKLAAARKVVTMMEESGVSPDSWTYGYLMTGLTEYGNPSAALTLFETACADSRTVGVTENVFLYTTAMTAAAKIGDYSRALELLSRMKALGIKPNMKTMTTLVGACLAGGKPELAVDIYRRIRNPDAYALTQGLIALAAAGNLEECLAMLADRKSLAGKLNGKRLNQVYEVMIKNAIDSGNFDMARNIIRSLLGRGDIPSKAIFQTIFHGMGLLVTKGLVSRVSFSEDGLVKRGELDEVDLEKFKFLLFLVDSVSSRNLPCEASLYSIILSYGAHLGGRPKKMATLMSAAKTAAGVYGSNKKLVEEEMPEKSVVASCWEELFLSYDDVHDRIESPISLPTIRVRIATREVPRVLRAEKLVSYRKRREV
jgi:pentatricopeptide repeat protein